MRQTVSSAPFISIAYLFATNHAGSLVCGRSEIFVAIASGQQARTRMTSNGADPVLSSPAELLRAIQTD